MMTSFKSYLTVKNILILIAVIITFSAGTYYALNLGKNAGPLASTISSSPPTSSPPTTIPTPKTAPPPSKEPMIKGSSNQCAIELVPCTGKISVIQNDKNIITYGDADCSKCGEPGEWVCVSVENDKQYQINGSFIPKGKWCLPTSFMDKSFERLVKTETGYSKLKDSTFIPNCTWIVSDLPESCPCDPKETYMKKKVTLLDKDKAYINDEYWNGYAQTPTKNCSALPILAGSEGLIDTRVPSSETLLNISPTLQTYKDIECDYSKKCSDCEFKVVDLEGKELEYTFVNNKLMLKYDCNLVTSNMPKDVDVVITKPTTPGGKPCGVQSGRQRLEYDTSKCPPVDCGFTEWKTTKSCNGCDTDKVEERSLIIPRFGGQPCDPSFNDLTKYPRYRVSSCERDPSCKEDCVYGWRPKDPQKACSSCTREDPREYVPTMEEVKYIEKEARGYGERCSGMEINNSWYNPRITECPKCQPIDCKITDWTPSGINCSDCSDPVRQENSSQIRSLLPGRYGGKTDCPTPTSMQLTPCDYSKCPVDCTIGNWIDETPGECSCNTTDPNAKNTKTQIGIEIGPFNGGKACPLDMPRRRVVPCDYSSCTNTQKIVIDTYQENVQEITSLIPINTAKMTIQLWGGGGSTARRSWNGTFSGGGGGGYSSITIVYKPEYRYFVFVGKAGDMRDASRSQVLRGGRPIADQGGAGGDGSLFMIYDGFQYTVLAIAGGGGGGVTELTGYAGAGGQDANPGGKAGQNGRGAILPDASFGLDCSLVVRDLNTIWGFGGDSNINYSYGQITASGGGGYGGGSSGRSFEITGKSESGGGGGNYAASTSNLVSILNSETEAGDKTTPGKVDDPNRNNFGQGGMSGMGTNGGIVLTCLLQSQNCTIGNWQDQDPNACSCDLVPRPSTKLQIGSEVGPFLGGSPCTGNEPKTRQVSCDYSQCGCKVSEWSECKVWDTVNNCGRGRQTRTVIYPDLSGNQPCPQLDQQCNRACESYYITTQYNTLHIRLDPFEWGVDIEALNSIGVNNMTRAYISDGVASIITLSNQSASTTFTANKPIRTIIDEINAKLKNQVNFYEGISWNASTKQLKNISRSSSSLGQIGATGWEIITIRGTFNNMVDLPVKLVDSAKIITITVPSQRYTPQELVDTINNQFRTLSTDLNISYDANSQRFTLSRSDMVSTVGYKREIKEINGVWQWVDEYLKYPRTFSLLNLVGGQFSSLQNILGTLPFDTSQQSVTSGTSIYAGLVYLQ